MKKILILLVLFFFLATEAYADEDLVYLKVEGASASSFDSTPDWAPQPNPFAPVDGDLETRWSPELGLDNEWIYFDFGQKKVLSRIIIRWERAYAKSYEILVSDDAKDWKRLVLVKDENGGIDTIDVEETSCRYVKLVGLERINPNWGFSLWEMEMYGPKDKNPLDKPLYEVFPDRKKREEEKVELVFEEPLTSAGALTLDEFQKGVGYVAFHETLLAQSTSDELLEHMADLGVTCVSLVTTWFQDNLDSSKMYPEPREAGRTPCDETLTHAINKMHSLGMKVMLKPHLNVVTGEFRGEIYPLDEKEWFKNYKEFILHYAKLASKYNVEFFCVGTELKGMTLPHADYTKAWYEIINEVKKIYKGPLIYSANFDEYEHVTFWDKLDFVGIDAYFPLTSKNDPSREELISAWQKWASQIEEWRQDKEIDKPLIFSEIGYASSDGCNKEPWHLTSKTQDEKEQAQCLEAVLTVMSEKDWFKGLYWWGYFPQGEASEIGYSLKGKQGEKILSSWYRKLR